MIESTAILEDWKFEGHLKDDNFHLSGKIYNDKKNRFNDGQKVYTSRIEEINFQDGWAKTKNSIYKLGACNI